jgi:hypothetical protein
VGRHCRRRDGGGEQGAKVWGCVATGTGFYISGG